MVILLIGCMTFERALATRVRQVTLETLQKTWSIHGASMESQAMKCHLVAFLGPRGLTRMALRFQEPSSASCAMDLTSACNACNVHQDVQVMKDRARGELEPKLLEIRGES